MSNVAPTRGRGGAPAAARGRGGGANRGGGGAGRGAARLPVAVPPGANTVSLTGAMSTLTAMFRTIDPAVIGLVLEANRYHMEQTVESLLAMQTAAPKPAAPAPAPTVVVVHPIPQQPQPQPLAVATPVRATLHATPVSAARPTARATPIATPAPASATPNRPAATPASVDRKQPPPTPSAAPLSANAILAGGLPDDFLRPPSYFQRLARNTKPAAAASATPNRPAVPVPTFDPRRTQPASGAPAHRYQTSDEQLNQFLADELFMQQLAANPNFFMSASPSPPLPSPQPASRTAATTTAAATPNRPAGAATTSATPPVASGRINGLRSPYAESVATERAIARAAMDDDSASAAYSISEQMEIERVLAAERANAARAAAAAGTSKPASTKPVSGVDSKAGGTATGAPSLSRAGSAAGNTNPASAAASAAAAAAAAKAKAASTAAAISMALSLTPETVSAADDNYGGGSGPSAGAASPTISSSGAALPAGSESLSDKFQSLGDAAKQKLLYFARTIRRGLAGPKAHEKSAVSDAQINTEYASLSAADHDAMGIAGPASAGGGGISPHSSVGAADLLSAALSPPPPPVPVSSIPELRGRMVNGQLILEDDIADADAAAGSAAAAAANGSGASVASVQTPASASAGLDDRESMRQRAGEATASSLHHSSMILPPPPEM